ncbi:MAG TPA: hypothetical protein VFX37_09840 [Pseudolabrys sp.]|nr:hypothetical protein [Pseudolabrys sp.]
MTGHREDLIIGHTESANGLIVAYAGDQRLGAFETGSAAKEAIVKVWSSSECDRLRSENERLREALKRYLDACGHLPIFGDGSIPDIRKAGEVAAAREAAEAALSTSESSK